MSSWHARSLIIANGALERIIPFPGWTTPGVIGLAASTILLKSQYVLPGQSTVVAGCGPLLIAVANGIIKSGGKVSAIIDLNSKSDWIKAFPRLLSRPDQLFKGMSWFANIMKAGIKLYGGHAVTNTKQVDNVLRISIAPINSAGSILDSKNQKIVEGDCLAIGHGLFPSTEITRLLKAKHIYDPLKGGWVPLIDDDFRSSIPGVYIAGDATGISGAFSAVQKGRIAGMTAVRDLNMMSSKKYKAKITGLDLSVNMLEVAKKKSIKYNTNDIIFIESTVFPGVTEQCKNYLEKKTDLKNKCQPFVIICF